MPAAQKTPPMEKLTNISKNPLSSKKVKSFSLLLHTNRNTGIITTPFEDDQKRTFFQLQLSRMEFCAVIWFAHQLVNTRFPPNLHFSHCVDHDLTKKFLLLLNLAQDLIFYINERIHHTHTHLHDAFIEEL